MNMKIIDLLKKIANGEEVPKKIKYLTTIYTLRSNLNYYEEDKDSTFKNGLYYQFIGSSRLNDEVEIIEEEPRDIEVCGSLFTKSEYDKLAHSEEEKKIPEKLNISNFPKHNNSLKKTAIKLNEIIDYLKNKGDE